MFARHGGSSRKHPPKINSRIQLPLPADLLGHSFQCTNAIVSLEIVYNLMFVPPLVALLATVANRQVLNHVAHAYLYRKVLVKAVGGVVTIVLAMLILVTA